MCLFNKPAVGLLWYLISNNAYNIIMRQTGYNSQILHPLSINNLLTKQYWPFRQSLSQVLHHDPVSYTSPVLLLGE